MGWPNAADYYEAIQNLGAVVSDAEVAQGEVETNALGLPITYSGNFADVYKVRCAATGNTWAVKCFKREVRGLAERYRDVSTFLASARLPFMVDFQYVEPGIRVNGVRYPFLKMKWIEGLRLNDFILRYIDNRGVLKQLQRLWHLLAVRMRQADLAHADLQHGNVLLVPQGDAGFGLRLIDYDGLCTPNLKERPSGELGHPAYQHPQRARDNFYGPEVDRFSHLAIYCAIQCLRTEPELWKRFNNEENLLFRESDFKNPRESELFQTALQLRSGTTRALVGKLALAAVRPLKETPYLDEIVVEDRVFLTPDEADEIGSLFGPRPGSSSSRRGGSASPETPETSSPSVTPMMSFSAMAASAASESRTTSPFDADSVFKAAPRTLPGAGIEPPPSAPAVPTPFEAPSPFRSVAPAWPPAAPVPAPIVAPAMPAPVLQPSLPSAAEAERALAIATERPLYKATALLMIAMGALGASLALSTTVWLNVIPGRPQWTTLGPALFMAGVASLAVLNGGWRMLIRRNYGQALMGAIVAVFCTFSPCFALGVPGLMALLLLLRPEVQRAFPD